MIDVLVSYIPLVFVLICVVSLATGGFKYRRELQKANTYHDHLLWGIATLLMCLLVVYLHSRGVNEDGFVAPIIMGMLLLGLFFFMSLLPVMMLKKRVRG